jgi:hypothetical protein
MKQVKRENIFLELVESVYKNDAKILVNMVCRKPIKGITPEIINQVYGEGFIPIPEPEVVNSKPSRANKSVEKK